MSRMCTSPNAAGRLAVVVSLLAWGCGGGGTASYTIGGVVSGLASGQRVTLLNNGADALLLLGNGSFTFATPVASAGSYSVTVATQPAGQTCTVTGGSGSGITARVTSVSVTCLDNPALALLAGNPYGPGNRDAVGASASFNYPMNVAVDGAGNVYVADVQNQTIRRVTAAGAVTTLAGLAGMSGNADGAGAGARFYNPCDVAVDSSGNVFVADFSNHTVRKITSAGVVTTFAGAAGTPGSADGTGAGARFTNPRGVAIDGAGNVLVADFGNHTIRKINPAGVVTTLAGSAGTPGTADGTGAAARFDKPEDVAADGAGNVYVSDGNNSTIRKITPAAVVTTLAGTAGSTGTADGTGAAARFGLPAGIAVDSAGVVYVAELAFHTIRKITPAAVVTTLAGTAGTPGTADGIGAAARFYAPGGVAVDGTGSVFVADTDNHTIRKITPTAVVATLAGTAGETGGADGTGAAARFNYPVGVAADGSGNAYVADMYNCTLRKVTAAGAVTTLAGTAGMSGSWDGIGAAATFWFPQGVAVDNSGNLYVADTSTNIIRKVTPAGVVSTLAGMPGGIGSADGTGAAASFRRPRGIAVDHSGVVYVADSENQTIRRISPGGVVTTLAGAARVTGAADGAGAAARFNNPMDVAVDGAGNVYVADSFNDTIRKITPAGVVSTLAGTASQTGSADGTGGAARFDEPVGIAVDGSGNLYVADSGNSTIRKVTAGGVVTTVVGAPRVAGFEPGGLPGIVSYPRSVAISGTTLFVTINNAVAVITNVR